MLGSHGIEELGQTPGAEETKDDHGPRRQGHGNLSGDQIQPLRSPVGSDQPEHEKAGDKEDAQHKR